MATLPNPGMDFTAFDELTDSQLDDLVENIEYLNSIAATKNAVDANGWECYDFGVFKIYKRRVTFSVTKVSGEYTTLANASLPVGMSTIGSNFVKASLACQYADDLQHGLKTNNTGATSLPYSAKCLASTTFSGWVDFEIWTA